MKIISAFKTVREMPYRIPLALDEEDLCCSGKHKMLKDLLTKQGIKTRYRVCTFSWNSIDLPKEILNIPHDQLSTHLFLEIMINNEWIIIDATWDLGLKNIFHINEWDGKSNTKIAVEPIEMYSPQKSADIMNNESDKEILDDLKTNRELYKAFNDWLQENRKLSVSE